VLKFFLTQIKEGHSTFESRVSPSEVNLQENDEFSDPIEITHLVDKIGDEVFVKTRLQTLAVLTCDRCLDQYKMTIDEKIDAILTHDDDLAVQEEEDIILVTKSTREVDISESVRQALLLAIPFKKLCREGCKGLCPRCGANLNHTPCSCAKEKQDPRWDALRNINFE
jgi:uncharacterized protein